MKKRLLRERIGYQFDRILSRGPIAMTLLLLAITATAVGVIGIAAYLVADEGGLIYQIWMSLMHTLDAGTLANNSTDNVPYVILMSLATLCGLFLTSVLIGVVATGVENKLSDLRKGTSVVQEMHHTVIIGFDGNIYTLLNELIEANSNHKKQCVVVLGTQPKEDMEDAIASHIPNTRTTHIICRSGGLHETYSLERCAVENCRSVIVNIQDDEDVIKTLLALAAYVKDKDLTHPDLRFVAALQEEKYYEPANIAGDGRAVVIYTKDAIARIIANTCRQHGLSQVLTELFNFDGHELYFETVPELTGKTFKEATLSFSNAIAIGLYADDRAQLNPPMDTVIGAKDQIILLELDDGAFKVHAPRVVNSACIRNTQSIAAQASDNLIILGSNDKLPIILNEYNLYVRPNTRVVIADDDFDESRLSVYENLNITICNKPLTRALLCEFLEDHANNILLLNDDSQDSDHSDSQTLLRLILLRDIADKTGKYFAITTEMRSVDNQQLAIQARVDDFVIGSNFASLMLAQLSENPLLEPLIGDLLDEDGSELYMKPVADYIHIDQPVDSYVLTESAARRGEIYVGYRHMDDANSDVIVNPDKDKKILFGPNDQIVVIAEN